MNKIILATSNPHKVDEIKNILSMYDILTPKDIGFTGEIVEDGYTFEDNAMIKARAIMDYALSKNIHYAVLADDSGLCVKAINYEPGIMSARYSGGDDEANRQKLLSKLLTITDRTAYFQCYAVILFPDGSSFVADGKTYGLITRTKIGDESFGYDCIFWSDKLRKTFGQATIEEKQKVSHRAIAINKIKDYLDEINYAGRDEDEEY